MIALTNFPGFFLKLFKLFFEGSVSTCVLTNYPPPLSKSNRNRFFTLKANPLPFHLGITFIKRSPGIVLKHNKTLFLTGKNKFV